MKEEIRILGVVEVSVLGPQGIIKFHSIQPNIVTAVGDGIYTSRAVSGTSSTFVNGMKLGTGSTAPSKSGAGAVLSSYVPDSNQTLSGQPSINGSSVTYSAEWGKGKATTESPITEVALIMDEEVDGPSPSSSVVARALVSEIPKKGPEDVVIINWTHNFLGT